MSTVRPTLEATRVGTDPFDLTGRVALVTGAARGIGQSIAVELARRGAHVVVADMRDPSETVALLRDGLPAGTHEGKAVDVREREQVENVVSDTVEHFGCLDLRGTFLFCRAAISPWMSEQRVGAIINIGSISGIMGGPSSGSADQVRSGHACAASKGGVIALTKRLAKEVGALGITVNSVAPGPIATTLTEDVAYDFSQEILPRTGTPEEIGAAMAYLASPAAAYVTGHVLRVCGGAALE